MYFPELGIEEEGAPEHDRPIPTLNYEILIHLDEVTDYTPLSDSLEGQSQESATSGMPSPSSEVWPKKHTFAWNLGVKDGCRPQWPRVPAQDRLQRPGDRRRDRSPPGGGQQEKRRRHDGGQSSAGGRPWVSEESSAAWHLQGGRSSQPAGRRRAGSCPPSLYHNGEAKGDGGPKEAPVGPQPSKRKTPEDTLMVVDAVMA